MASDPGIYAQAGKVATPIQNPMEVQQNALAVSNAMIQNKLAQAGIVRGQLAQQAIDPATGQFSPTAYNKLVGSTPDAAAGSMDAVQQSQGLMGAQNTLAQSQNAVLQQTLGAVANLPDDQIHAGAAAALDSIVSRGLMKPEDAYYQMSHLSNVPSEMRRQLLVARMSMMSPVDQTTSTTGVAGTQTNGQSTQPGMVPGGLSTAMGGPQSGSFSAAGKATPIYPSRDTLAGQVPGIDNKGNPINQPLGGRLNDQGSDLGGPANVQPSRFPGALLPQGYTGKYAPNAQVPTGTPAPNAQVPTAAPQSGGQTGAVVTGLAPGQLDEAKSSVDHLAQARDAANNYQDRIQPLQSAQTALANSKTGEGSSFVNTVRQRLQTYTPDFMNGFRPIGGTAEQDAAFDEGQKYMLNYANRTPGASRSDAGGTSAENQNANNHISPLAAKYVLRAATGMEKMRQAQTLEFNASGQPGSSYDRSQAIAATSVDPRAFVADQYTGDENKAMLASMNPTQKAAYFSSLRLGMKHGLVSLPSAAPAPQAPQRNLSTIVPN